MNRQQIERNQAQVELPKCGGGRPKVKKSSFSIIFVTQNGKAKADGTVPILARITVNGEMCHFSTRQTILPDRWLSKEYRTVGKTKEEKNTNTILEDLKALIKRRYTEFITAGQVVTANRLKQSIMSLDETSKSYLELCDLFIKDYEKLTTWTSPPKMQIKFSNIADRCSQIIERILLWIWYIIIHYYPSSATSKAFSLIISNRLSLSRPTQKAKA